MIDQMETRNSREIASDTARPGQKVPVLVALVYVSLWPRDRLLSPEAIEVRLA